MVQKETKERVGRPMLFSFTVIPDKKFNWMYSKSEGEYRKRGGEYSETTIVVKHVMVTTAVSLQCLALSFLRPPVFSLSLSRSLSRKRSSLASSPALFFQQSEWRPVQGWIWFFESTWVLWVVQLFLSGWRRGDIVKGSVCMNNLLPIWLWLDIHNV